MSVKVLDLLLSVLQGICMTGVRGNAGFQAERETARNIREAFEEEWVVETLIDLLSWSKLVPSPASPTHQILNTLFTILVYVPSTLPTFSQAGGYEIIAGLLKLVDEKQVKVKAIELFVYLGSLATDQGESGRKGQREESQEDDVDVFGTPKPINILPATPRSTRTTTQSNSRHIPSNHALGRTPSAQSSSSTLSNHADADLLRTPVVSENGSDVEIWSEDGERGVGNTRQAAHTAASPRVEQQEGFRFPMSKSSSALSSYGFYTPQQRAEKHRPSHGSTSGSSQEESVISESTGLPVMKLRRSSLSSRPSTSHKRIPSLRSLARVEEELALTPKKLVDMSPARLKADFKDSEVREDMRSTIRLRPSTGPSSKLRSPRTPAAGDSRSRRKDSSAEISSANPSPTKDSSRDSSRSALPSLGPSRSTDPRLLIPSAKANIGLGFPKSRGDVSTASQPTKSRTGSAEYPPELAQDPRIRSVHSLEKAGHGQASRTSSNGSTSSVISAISGSKGVTRSHTSTQLADVLSKDQDGLASATNTIRLCRSIGRGTEQ
ncbi:hypothetical protein QFC19_008150 [Naganishia cerealis]|uniref:Uncharacterized protein n=1 Tax=Naganishia cerealis TaxID=610337 RepID=A0ACC2V5Q7_9TREE|nr:hypothetical protein QFC19_008150 [Naganishia cerealis]